MKVTTRNEAYRQKPKKIPAPVPVERPEHPDDKAMREESERTAAREIDTFMAKLKPEQIKALVQTYADAEAEDLLRNIREDFWANLSDS